MGTPRSRGDVMAPSRQAGPLVGRTPAQPWATRRAKPRQAREIVRRALRHDARFARQYDGCPAPPTQRARPLGQARVRPQGCLRGRAAARAAGEAERGARPSHPRQALDRAHRLAPARAHLRSLLLRTLRRRAAAPAGLLSARAPLDLRGPVPAASDEQRNRDLERARRRPSPHEGGAVHRRPSSSRNPRPGTRRSSSRRSSTFHPYSARTCVLRSRSGSSPMTSPARSSTIDTQTGAPSRWSRSPARCSTPTTTPCR